MEQSNDRKGTSWTDDEVLQLLQLIQKKKTDQEIATELQRTSGAIRSRRRVMAADYHFNNKFEADKIMKLTGLNEKEINDAIERRKPSEFKRLLRLKREVETQPAEPLVPPTTFKKSYTKKEIFARIDNLESMLKDMQGKFDLLLATAASPPTAAASPRPA